MAHKPAEEGSVPGYRVETPSASEQAFLLTKVIPMRRGPTSSVPGLTLAEGLVAGDSMFDRFSMPQYSHMVTAEMKSRPIPHVFESKIMRPLINLFTEWQPHTMRWYLKQLEAPYQTFNNTSRVGYPTFTRPDDKLAFLRPHISSVCGGDLSRYEDGYIAMNVRCQVDPRGKEREFLFISDDNDVYMKRITSENRLVRTPVGVRTCSRTRLVFNLPEYNLVKQPLDTAIHNVFLRYPAFHHDMFNNRLLPVRGYHICMDVKHFERATAECNRIRAAMLGGVYSKCASLTAALPFAVPTDDWRGARKVFVDRIGGYSDQYASGDSAVAPSQKEILMAIYASFFHKELGYSKDACVQQVALGGDHRLTIRNYGDDNSFDGDKKVVEAFMQYAALFLTVEEEKPPKFLGFVWSTERRKWELPIESYLTKNYLSERAPHTNFRKYPFMGWVEKRKVYQTLGQPIVASKVFPAEDDLMASFGLPWYEILRRADIERQESMRANIELTNPLFTLEKDYMMTPEQRIATGLYTGLKPEDTLPILKAMLSAENFKETNL